MRRVFITDDADLLPAYLRFVRGVIDSEDLPLNISREMLQNNPQLAQIRKAVTGRVIGELETLGEKQPESFAKIWDAFGPVIKEGIYEDYERREKLLALSRFTTTSGEMRTLKQYVADLKPNQTEIYFLVGDSIERLKSNPKLELATARGIEVLLLTDPVDAFWTSAPLDFEGKPLKSLSQGDIDFGLVPLLDDKKEEVKPGADEASIIAVIKANLGDRSSPTCAHRNGSPPARRAWSPAVTGLTASWSACWPGKIAASAPSPFLKSTSAIPWSQRSLRPARTPPICLSSCWSRRRSLMANYRRIRPLSRTD